MRMLIAVFATVLCLSTVVAFAGSDGPIEGDLSAEAVEAPDAGVAAQPDLGDAARDAWEKVDAYRDAPSAEKRLALFSMLASLFGLVAMLAVRLGKLTDRGRAWLPYVGLAAGVGVALFTKLGVGWSWADALLLGAAPTFMGGLHQLMVQRRKRKDE